MASSGKVQDTKGLSPISPTVTEDTTTIPLVSQVNVPETEVNDAGEIQVEDINYSDENSSYQEEEEESGTEIIYTGEVHVEDTNPTEVKYHHKHNGIIREEIITNSEGGFDELMEEDPIGRKTMENPEGNPEDEYLSLRVKTSGINNASFHYFQVLESLKVYDKNGRRRPNARHFYPPTREDSVVNHNRAILVGLSYERSKSRNLPTSKYNLIKMKNLLKDNFGWSDSDIFIFSDVYHENPEEHHHNQAFRSRLLTAARQLVKNVKSGDNLLFYFCGHGTQVAGDEHDRLDEVIVTADDVYITDNELTRIFCNPKIPSGVNITCIFDECHAGTMLDLEHVYERDDKLWYRSSGVTDYTRTKANVVCLSGCLDSELAWEASRFVTSIGSTFTARLCQVLERPDRTYYGILRSLAYYLWEKEFPKFRQTPCISSSRKLDETSELKIQCR